MAAKLDTKLVQGLEPPAKGNRITFDAVVKGFGCRVTAAGAKSFILNYRAGGRARRYTIGSFPDWSVVAARNEAAQLKREIDRGRDPMAERDHDRQAPTVSQLCDRYLAEHADVHNKPRTSAENRRMVEKIIKPRLGRLKAAAVEYEDVARLHRDMGRTPRQANHAVAILSKMFNLAERWTLRPLNSNPCRHIKRYPETARDRYLTTAELAAVGAVLRELEAAGKIRPAVAACIRFLALTGCRLSEATDLRWDAIDTRAGTWRLSHAKAGARVAPLGAPALALLASLKVDGDRVFPGIVANTIEHVWAGEKAQPELGKKGRPGIRDRAGIPDARIHDLRHTVGTYAGGAGLNAFMVRDLLGHRTMAMTGRYVSRHADPLSRAADVVSGQIAAALDGAPAEVVNIKSGRAS